MSVRRSRPAEAGGGESAERARRRLASWTNGGRYDRPLVHTGDPDCFACMVESQVRRWREIVAGTGGRGGQGEPSRGPTPGHADLHTAQKGPNP